MTTSIGAHAHADPVHALPLLEASVGYGELGVGGSLGYDGGRVQVAGEHRADALSTHPPARLRYHLEGRARRFAAHVALDDDVPPDAHAFFDVAVDDRVVASSGRVTAGAPPLAIGADLRGAHVLELRVRTERFDCAHALWLAPEVEAGPPAERVTDCLGRVDVEVQEQEQCDVCVATLASRGYEDLLDDMLGSLASNGNLAGARVVVFVLDDRTGTTARVAAGHGALVVPCRSRARVSMASKAVLYSAALTVPARRFLCVDADMLVLGDLAPVAAALDALPDDRLLVCREGNSSFYGSVEEILTHAYGGRPADVAAILGADEGEGGYPLVANDGLFAAGRRAMLRLDAAIRAMPGARAWLDAPPHVPWRNQLIFNLALAQLDCGVELDPRFNVQLHTTDVDIASDGAVRWRGGTVSVLHLNGSGRNKHPELRGQRTRRVA